jgi:hypothetical protein
MPPLRLKLFLRIFGLVILLAGYGGATWLWHAQIAEDQTISADAPLSGLDSRKDTRQTEIMYGKSGLVMERWTEFAENLLHGKNLVRMIIVVSSIIAIGCFVAAGKVSLPDDAAESRRPV